MTTTTIIINGFARAGKDSFVDACAEHLSETQTRLYAFSSIDPVRDLMGQAGIDLSAKTDADRRLLADIGAALEAHSNWRTNKCIAYVTAKAEKGLRGGHDTVVFLHIREPENIVKVIEGVWKLAIGPVYTLLLRSPREVMPDNVADNSVLRMPYGEIINNDGTLGDLIDKAHAYLKLKGLV